VSPMPPIPAAAHSFSWIITAVPPPMLPIF
jgi:hypothetical protein